MKKFYILFRVPDASLPFTNTPNSPWRLFWTGNDPEKAWRQYGMFHKDSPVRKYRFKAQLRAINFKDRPLELQLENPEDYDFEGTR